MKNLSFHSRAQAVVLLLCGLLAACVAWKWLSHGFDFAGVAFLIAAAVAGHLFVLRNRSDVALIDQLTRVVHEVAAGRTGSRITRIDQEDELGRLCWEMNDMLDQLETCFREQRTCLSYAAERKYYRIPQKVGLHGAFAEVMKRTNESLETLKSNVSLEQRNELISRLGELNSANLLANLEMNQRDMRGIAEATAVLEKLSKENVASAEDSQDRVIAVLGALKEIAERVDSSSTAMQALNGLSEEVSRSVGVISDIADQTNLLALNAAIEAARAGESGRGFAVVADEVRKLAEKSKNASTEISAVMDTLRHDAAAMLESAETMRAMARESAEQAAGAEQRFMSMANAAREAQEKIVYVNDVCFASLAKVDLLHYKQNAYISVIGDGNEGSKSVVRAGVHECRFGKWLDAQAETPAYGSLPAFRQVFGPHERVHSEFQAAVGIASQSAELDPALRKRIYEHFEAGEKASTETFVLLDQMIQQRFKSSGVTLF